MTTKLAIIEANSGYVWGESRLTDPVAAVREILQALGEDHVGAEWEMLSRNPRTTKDGFDVYRVHGDLVIDDGQDESTIEAVEAGELCGFVHDASLDEMVEDGWIGEIQASDASVDRRRGRPG